MEFAGGNTFSLPSGGTVFSANVTPDTQTGIGKWSKDFIKLFKTYTDEAATFPVKDGEFNTVMPQREFAGIAEEELGASYMPI